MNKTLALMLAGMMTSAAVNAQKIKLTKDYDVTITGSVQSDILVPQEDHNIGTGTYDDKVLTNTYAEVHALSKYVDAGARLEYLDHPLPGFEPDFKGWGVPFYYVKGKIKNAELTLGNFYEQFGSGFILRTYEERSLGIDNSLLGGRLVVRPFKGVQVKALAGKQRRYWEHTSLVSGADVEVSVDQWFEKMQQKGTFLTLGGSWVNKHEKEEGDIMADPTHKLNVPENTNAFDVRANLQAGDFSVLAEYAQKTEDPTFDKNFPYIYRKGYVAMLSTSYSRSGMSLLLQAKRSDNMGFRSRRTETVRQLSSTTSRHSPSSRHTLSQHSIPTPHSSTANGLIRQSSDISSSATQRSAASMAQASSSTSHTFTPSSRTRRRAADRVRTDMARLSGSGATRHTIRTSTCKLRRSSRSRSNSTSCI